MPVKRARCVPASSSSQTAIELGHIFKLGTFYSVPFEATFLDEGGEEKPLVMGSYGIGPARTMAAIVEQHHDDQGIAWPLAVAPYDVHVVVLPGQEEHGGEGRRVCSTTPGSTCFWMTATGAPERSSPTPI